jgi:hypothetical protein
MCAQALKRRRNPAHHREHQASHKRHEPYERNDQNEDQRQINVPSPICILGGTRWGLQGSEQSDRKDRPLPRRQRTSGNQNHRPGCPDKLAWRGNTHLKGVPNLEGRHRTLNAETIAPATANKKASATKIPGPIDANPAFWPPYRHSASRGLKLSLVGEGCRAVAVNFRFITRAAIPGENARETYCERKGENRSVPLMRFLSPSLFTHRLIDQLLHGTRACRCAVALPAAPCLPHPVHLSGERQGSQSAL